MKKKLIASNRLLNLTTNVMLKAGKHHASTSRQSAERLNYLSSVHISEWEYTFQVTYVLSGVWRIFI